MTGPAYVDTVNLGEFASQVGLGPMFVPTCLAHERPWVGASSRVESTALAGVREHNVDVHGGE